MSVSQAVNRWFPRAAASRSATVLAALSWFVMTPAASAQETPGIPRCATTKIEVERLWCQGSAAFIQQTPAGFAKAIGPYSRALALEKKRRALGRNAWLALIDNLGMAYGISGDLPKAREILEYGLTKEPSYPMFYYNLACAYAEMGNKAKAVDNLKRAFALRANMIPGETIPDPATDDSFHRFMEDQSFVNALQALPGRGR